MLHDIRKSSLSSLSVLFVCLCLIFSSSGISWAANASSKTPAKVVVSTQETPCFVLMGKRWKKVSDAECIQMSLETYRSYVDRLVQLKSLKKDVIPKLQTIQKKYEQLQTLWELSHQSWKQQTQRLQFLVTASQRQMEFYQKAYETLQKRKAPKQSWVIHPAFWFAVGAVAGVGTTIGITALVLHVNSK